ncbi:MAG: hypothetical protein ACI4L6_02465 [Candidatus Onthoplasma sp.]
MSVNNKKILSIIVYYTLAGLTLLFSGFFIFCLIAKDVALWAKIVYFVWIGFVIGEIIFDIICTSAGEAKQISGLIAYVLSLLAVAMAVVLYIINAGKTGLATDYFNLFISISLVSLFTTGFMIGTWVVGEGLVEHTSAEKKIQQRKPNNT